jgi:hypothetical protein
VPSHLLVGIGLLLLGPLLQQQALLLQPRLLPLLLLGSLLADLRREGGDKQQNNMS